MFIEENGPLNSILLVPGWAEEKKHFNIFDKYF